jgi:methylglutaconyl-CoA hydratase
MTYETLKCEIDKRGVATLTLARSEKHNAMSSVMIAELQHAADTLGADKNVRVVVLAAEGKSFCAGGDLGWMRDQMAVTTEKRRVEARKLANMLNTLNTLPKPVIAAVQGNAFGGGIGLMCVADTAVGVSTARFGLTETKLGLIPATISPYVIARMGEGRARQIFMSGRLIGAVEAEKLGLISKVVSADALEKTIEDEIAPYLLCAPEAVAKAKRLARMLGPTIDQSVIDATIELLIECWDGDEASAGIEAFFAKRPAPWTN